MEDAVRQAQVECEQILEASIVKFKASRQAPYVFQQFLQEEWPEDYALFKRNENGDQALTRSYESWRAKFEFTVPDDGTDGDGTDGGTDGGSGSSSGHGRFDTGTNAAGEGEAEETKEEDGTNGTDIAAGPGPGPGPGPCLGAGAGAGAGATVGASRGPRLMRAWGRGQSMQAEIPSLSAPSVATRRLGRGRTAIRPAASGFRSMVAVARAKTR